MITQSSSRRAPLTHLSIVVLLVVVAIIAAYITMRYEGRWSDSDSGSLARIIRAMVSESRLEPDAAMYNNGYGFPVLATFLVRITGLSVMQLQFFGGMFLAVLLVIPAWLAYRELTGSARGATLSTVIILVQPDFLFFILRGTHEKFTRGLMFLALYLLVRSLYARRNWKLQAAFLLALYLVMYALITFNNLLAISFISALTMSLILVLVVQQLSDDRTHNGSATSRRLLYAVLISLVLAFFFTFYAYPPARTSLYVYESIFDRFALLFLEVEEEIVNPYHAVSIGWISPSVYLLISISTWLILIGSFIIWSWQSLSWLRNRSWPREPRVILRWSLYGAFGFLGAFSIASDFSGSLSSNLQHRVFPSIVMIAAAVVSEWIVRWKFQRPVAQRLFSFALVTLFVSLGIITTFKLTNEPLLSNNWQYYSEAEKAGVFWGREYVGSSSLWVGLNERMRSAMGLCCGDDLANLHMQDGYLSPGVRDMLLSDIIRARAQRVGFDLPVEGDSFRVYDNGAADLYHLRPLTPFQR